MVECSEISLAETEFKSVKDHYNLFRNIDAATSADIETVSGEITYRIKTGKKHSTMSDPILLRTTIIDVYRNEDGLIIRDIHIKGTGTVFIRIMQAERAQDVE